MPSRYFTIEKTSISIPKGRYEAAKPIEAAKKIASKLFMLTDDLKISFSIRETTKNSAKRVYHYEATQYAIHSYYDDKLSEILTRFCQKSYSDNQRIIMSAKEFSRLQGYLHTKENLYISSPKIQINNIKVSKTRITFNATLACRMIFIEIIKE